MDNRCDQITTQVGGVQQELGKMKSVELKINEKTRESYVNCFRTLGELMLYELIAGVSASEKNRVGGEDLHNYRHISYKDSKV